jgi:hypothetical protein
MGVEPTTPALRKRCSAIELLRHGRGPAGKENKRKPVPDARLTRAGIKTHQRLQVFAGSISQHVMRAHPIRPILNRPKLQPWTIVLAAATFLAGGIFVYILFVNIKVISIDAPQEFRENAFLLSTHQLLIGENPYDVSSQPVYMNAYGIGYHLVAYPLAKVFGSTFWLHRLISSACIWGMLALLFAVMRRRGAGVALAMIGCVFLYADLAIRTSDYPIRSSPLTITARPDALGMLLFLLSIIIPWWRGFSNRSLAVSGVLAIAALLTKAYFFLGFPMVAGYVLLFVRKDKAILFTFGTLIFVAFTWRIVDRTMPEYVTMVVYENIGGMARLPIHLIRQLKEYIICRPGEVSVFLAVSACVLIPRLRNTAPHSILFDVRHWRRPVLTIELDYFVWVLLVSLAALVCSLGMHPGNAMLYFYQFLSPPFLIVVITFISRLHANWRLIAMLAVLIDLGLLTSRLPAPPQSHADVWSQWETLLQDKRNAFASPPLAHLLMRQGKPVYDNGQTDCYLLASYGAPEPIAAKVRQRKREFNREMRRMVQERVFDLIVVMEYDLGPYFPPNLLLQNYRRVRAMEMPMDFQPGWRAVIFEPIE